MRKLCDCVQKNRHIVEFEHCVGAAFSVLPLTEKVGYRAVNLRLIFSNLRIRQRGLPLAVRFLCADALQQVAYSITIQIIDLVCCLKGRPYNFKFIAVRRYHKLTANG